jgi:transcriptional regulator with XRE-family HTH domain
MTEDFGSTLRRYRLRAGLSQNALAKVVGINASYINRLESGEREAPTREVAHALARALTLAPEEVDRLLFSAGHVPPSLQKLGPADSTVAAVTRLLTNDRLSPEARADFRAVVETIAIRWQCNYAAVAANGIAHPANRNGRVAINGALSAVGAAH